MTNPLYSHATGVPVSQTRGTSATVRAEFDLVASAFDAVSNSVAGFATESGSLNNFVLTLTPQPASYPSKGTAFFVATHANTGAATLQIGALAVLPLLSNDGSALTANYISNGEVVMVYINGTNAYVLGATKSYVDNTAFSSAVPAQGGNSGKLLTTNGTSAFWGTSLTLMGLGSGTVGAPSLNLGDAATGNYRPALNQFALAINGAVSELNQASGKTVYGNLVFGSGITFPANMSQAQAQAAIGVPPLAGTGATGTWPISISGSAASSPIYSGTLAAIGAAALGANADITSLSALTSINGGYLYGNRIINGAQEIDQVNGGAAVTPGAGTAYLTDMFGAGVGQASKLTFQQVVDAPAGLKNSLKVTVAAQCAPAAADSFYIITCIEGKDVIDFQYGTAGAQTITLSNWIKGSVAGTYAVAMRNSASNRSYVGTVAVTTSWAQVKITLTGDAAGTWLTDSGTGLQIIWDLGSGSNFSTTAGSWQAGNFIRTAGSVTFVNQVAGSTLNITGVDCRLGSVAPTVFERRADELQLCQRYYHDSRSAGQGPTFSGITINASALTTNARFPVSMRVIPSVVLYSYANTAGKISLFGSGADVGTTLIVAPPNISREGFIQINDLGSGLTLSNVYWFAATASARLF